MSDVLIEQDTMEDIGDAIREKLGVSDTYLPSEMPSAIMSISGGGGDTLVIQDASIYSEDEQQVGIWTDGKPIYQKTWTGLNVTPSYNTWSNVIPNDVNIETLVRWQALSNVDYKNIDGTGIEWQVYGGYIRAEYNQNANIRTIEILTLQYTKTTDTAGSGGYKAYGLSPIIYSEEEREVGVWTDGKPLYQKTVHFSNVSTSGSVSFGVTNVENVFLADFGDLYDGATLPYVHSAAPSVSVGGFFVINANDLTWEFRSGGQAAAPLYGFITARYTKTTDTAGSGIWTTTGEYAHHYSTDEKVVGTWIDGSTLYEKTIDCGLAPNDENWHTVAHNISNLKNAVNMSGIIIKTDGTEEIPINSYRPSNTKGFVITRNGSNIQFMNNWSTANSYRLYVTIQYIKNT